MAIPDVSLLVFSLARDIFDARQKVSGLNTLLGVRHAASGFNARIARARW